MTAWTDNRHKSAQRKRPVPKMPEGYYSGDRPNPRLREFVEENMRPYDPATDRYDVPPFNEPITTTKATAIYNMHTYWSKKPHDAIRQYIRHYTRPGDIVLDPFCGSGGTALAALMEGRKAIAIDRSPAATFITKNYCTPVDVDKLQRAFEELKARVKPEIDWLYETRCDRCGGKAATAYTVYSQRFRCPRCLEVVALFDCPEVDGRTAKGKPKKIRVCPHCQRMGHQEEIKTSAEHFGAVPVLVSYICESGCKPARSERRHDDPDPKKREYFELYDLGKIREIEGKEIPHWYPKNKMMNVEDDSKPWGVEWREGRNFRTVDELFTRRNLWALARIREELKSLPPLTRGGFLITSGLLSDIRLGQR
ncbi:MAG TPA: DNA methyltransferase, partial [Methanothrix sp.]|nr:DNA methyltransferase [Methanothrix sp.]